MTLIWTGLGLASVYALVGYVYNQTWLGSGVLNFATAPLMVLGGFLGAWLIGDVGLPVAMVLLICAAIGAVLGSLEELVAIAPLKSVKLGLQFGESSHGWLITTLGVFSIILGACGIVWGYDARQVPLFAGGNNEAITLLGGTVRKVDLVLIAVALGMGIILKIWQDHSRTGLAGLAQTADADAAMLQGINVRMLSNMSFAVGGAIAVGLGPIIATKTLAAIAVALVIAIKGFIVITLGGVGNQLGTMGAAVGLGMVEALSARLLSPSLGLIVVFLLFMAILLVKPAGLLGKAGVRAV